MSPWLICWARSTFILPSLPKSLGPLMKMSRRSLCSARPNWKSGINQRTDFHERTKGVVLELRLNLLVPVSRIPVMRDTWDVFMKGVKAQLHLGSWILWRGLFLSWGFPNLGCVGAGHCVFLFVLLFRSFGGWSLGVVFKNHFSLKVLTPVSFRFLQVYSESFARFPQKSDVVTQISTRLLTNLVSSLYSRSIVTDRPVGLVASTSGSRPQTVIQFSRYSSWTYRYTSEYKIPISVSENSEGKLYFSWWKGFWGKVCDACIETICSDSKEHFHELFLLFLLHDEF